MLFITVLKIKHCDGHQGNRDLIHDVMNEFHVMISWRYNAKALNPKCHDRKYLKEKFLLCLSYVKMKFMNFSSQLPHIQLD